MDIAAKFLKEMAICLRNALDHRNPHVIIMNKIRENKDVIIFRGGHR